MRVGTVCYATDQGLGMLAKSFYDAGVITDVMLMKHRAYQNHPEWYPPGTHMFSSASFVGPAVDEFIDRIDTVLFFETPFDWSFPSRCKTRGVKTALMPMYEWSLRNPPHKFDVFLCPSLLDVDYFPDSPFLVPPVDPSTWKLRKTATKFLHNAGHIGHRNHKGTEELIQAIPMLDKDVCLTIRSQHLRRLEELVSKYHVDHPGVTLEYGQIPHHRLFDDYDVYVAPEKFNGLSLPLQESCAAGMLVMASDRYPANTWLPTDPLIPVYGYHRACISSAYMGFDEAEISPAAIAATINSWNGRDISELSMSGKRWAVEHSWDVMKPKFMKELSP